MRLLTLLVGSLFFSLQPVAVPEAMAQHRVYDPCTDGSINDGIPRSCDELKRELRRSDRYGRREWVIIGLCGPCAPIHAGTGASATGNRDPAESCVAG
ncbi:exported hypothetical protein [Agrobacterium tomkonis CFBP 6623]|uniref:Uncharacterized protein n=1 Tax=Agrobacterium tomkonis CFBP 6623 TaxID=1183432 RepID=A0A1S7QHP5_9HYPH|nr:exported hypothetical protein [Agrobacterium tomkonis CFBP 6623]